MNNINIKKNRNIISIIKNSIFGFAIGDALGVPYEFNERNSFKCTKMIASNGESYHGKLPIGTWSDDTSLMLCVLDALNGENEEKQYEYFKNNTIRWADYSEFTATDFVFDIGGTCKLGILKMKQEKENEFANSIKSNGNGGLMRILPLSFFQYNNNEEILKKISIFNKCSHNHIISNVGCLIYILLVKELLKTNDIKSALNIVVKQISEKYKIDEYKNIWTLEIFNKTEQVIKSGTYIVQTLEACIYCIYISSSYKEAVLRAVNLGGDTDTIAALTGGLMALNNNIPINYKLKLKRKKMISKLIEKTFT